MGVGVVGVQVNQLAIDTMDEAKRIQDIKDEANKRILALDPSWTVDNHEQKQRNDLMQGAGILLNICKAIRSGVSLDIDDAIAIGDTAMIKAVKIEAIRTMSNDAENNGDSLLTFQAALDIAGY